MFILGILFQNFSKKLNFEGGNCLVFQVREIDGFHQVGESKLLSFGSDTLNQLHNDRKYHSKLGFCILHRFFVVDGLDGVLDRDVDGIAWRCKVFCQRLCQAILNHHKNISKNTFVYIYIKINIFYMTPINFIHSILFMPVAPQIFSQVYHCPQSTHITNILNELSLHVFLLFIILIIM